MEDFAGSPDGLVLNALTKAPDMVKGVERYIQDQQGEEQLDRDKQPLQVPQADAEGSPPAANRRRIQIASSDLTNRKISIENVGGVSNEDTQISKKQSWEDQMRERQKERREKIAREKEAKEQEERERVQREKLEQARARKEYIDNLAREKKETKETRAAERKRVKLEKLEDRKSVV